MNQGINSNIPYAKSNISMQHREEAEILLSN
jgi:hypothetical protein